mgnify:CR=1 FL=1
MKVDPSIYYQETDGYAWIDYTVVNRFNRKFTLQTYEGEVCLFEETGYGNRIYTHHPQAVIQSLSADPQFKHLTLAQICELVKRFGMTKDYGFDPYREFDPPDLLSPTATARTIAIHAGLSCSLCDNKIWEPEPYDLEKVKYESLEGYEDAIKKQELRYGQFRFGYCGEPLFCTPCIQRTGKLNYCLYSFEEEQVNILRVCLGALRRLIKDVKKNPMTAT